MAKTLWKIPILKSADIWLATYITDEGKILIDTEMNWY